MGPDLMCFLQDEETGKFAVQAKFSKVLASLTWQDAINYVMPEFFYTIAVCFSLFECSYPLFLYIVEEWGKHRSPW